MKIECLKEKIQDAISKAEKITSKNASLPALKCIQLKAEKEGLFVRSTNLDIGIEIRVPSKTEEIGEITVPGSVLNGCIINLLNEKSVVLNTTDGNLSIVTNKNKTLIKTYPNEDYPIIPRVDTVNVYKVSSTAFINGIKGVWYSAANTSIKPELSSIRISSEEDYLVFVATDGFRLSEKKVKIKNKIEIEPIMVPVKNATEIVRVFEGLDEDLSIAVEQGQIAIFTENIYLVSRIVEGNYPDYRAIIPKDFLTNIIILKQDLINTFKLTSVFSDSFNHVRFIIDKTNKKISIVSKNGDVGEIENSLIGTIEGGDLEINFNYKYIADCLSSITSDSVDFSFSGINKPLVIRPIGDKNYLYLVMPMNK